MTVIFYFNRFFYHQNFLNFIAFFDHHFLEQFHFLCEFLLFALKLQNLNLIELVAHENFSVNSIELTVVGGYDVLNEIFFVEVHGGVHGGEFVGEVFTLFFGVFLGFDLVFDFIDDLMFFLFFGGRGFFFDGFLSFWRGFGDYWGFGAFVDEGDLIDVTVFEGFDELFEFIDLEGGFVFGVVDDGFGGCGEVDLFFVIDEFGEGGFHFGELFDEDLVIGLDFIDEGMIGFDDSGDDSGHEFDDGFELDCCLVVFLYDLIFFPTHFIVHFHHSLQIFTMRCYLVVDEEGIFDGSFFIGDGFVVVEEFEMLFLADLDIFDYSVQVFVQVLLHQFSVTEV